MIVKLTKEIIDYLYKTGSVVNDVHFTYIKPSNMWLSKDNTTNEIQIVVGNKPSILKIIDKQQIIEEINSL